MDINIVLPYVGAKTQYKIWANDEKNIDFRKQKEEAERCTLCFAATELEKYLVELGFQVSVAETEENIYNIVLCVAEEPIKSEDNGIEGEEFWFHYLENGLCIKGTGRIGVLYGVYELLNQQGIYWLNPWEEIIPNKKDSLILPGEKKYSPTFPLGRGFEFEGDLKESEKLALWMARNKLNLSSYREKTAKFQKKLGMIFKNGGHIFEEILDPDNVMPSGRTIWEEHPEWYGLPRTGIRKKNEALRTQFCMTNDGLLEYLAGKLLIKLQNDWYHADRIDIWGFDTWGSTCTCEKCKDIGNSSDQNMYFMSYLREYLDKAFLAGKLDRRVRLVVIAYEGTDNLKAPQNAIPKNIRKSGDYVTYAPILRCYDHCLNDEICEYNTFYNKHLKEWKDIPMGIIEYYNVSKFEDLPLLFTKTMPEDLKHYREVGVECMTYMHLPMILWGVRNLTQLLYASLCWDVTLDVEEYISQYFQNRYGVHAENIKKAYELLEKAGAQCSSWRSWGVKSILTGLQEWNGGRPAERLFEDNHLNGEADILGEKAVHHYNEAICILEEEKRKAEDCFVRNTEFVTGTAVNQREITLLSKVNTYGERINEDLISARYGRDCMKLITLFVKYYKSLEGGNSGEIIFQEIELLCEKMMSYYVPIRYEDKQTEVNCFDALKRSQLKDLYYRCKAWRVSELCKI